MLACSTGFLATAGLGWRTLGKDGTRDRLVLRPEDFGARGDGVANDTTAFAMLSSALERAGGGTVALSARTYLLGRQVRTNGPDHLLLGLPFLRLRGLRHGVRIEGNGAVLKAAPRLRFGAFRPDGLGALETSLPYYDRRSLAIPYEAMILVEDAQGPVSITDLSLDGNMEELVVGGPWGDIGHQVPMSGILLRNNQADELIGRVRSYGHGLDGIMIDGAEDFGFDRRISGVVCEDNGRQGCSIIGGSGYVVEDSTFSRSGRGRIASAPGAGVDLEAEGGKSVTRIRFVNCRFLDNSGPGVLAESGPVDRISFDNCLMVGTSAWSTWCRKPFMRHRGCTFVGAVANPHGSGTSDEAAWFDNCHFIDDPAATGFSRAYLPRGRSGPIIDAGGSFEGGRNVLLRHSSVVCRHGGELPWTRHAIYEDCLMTQASKQMAYPRGTYRGSTTIEGAVDLGGSIVAGEVDVNGRSLASTQL